MTTIEHTPKERGLIKHLSRRNHQLWDKKKELIESYYIAIKMFSEIDIDLVWKYIEKVNIWEKGWAYTTIDDYVNKSGKIHKAHFNKNNKYIGTTKEYGNEPIKILTMMPLTKKNFDLKMPIDKIPIFIPIDNCEEKKKKKFKVKTID